MDPTPRRPGGSDTPCRIVAARRAPGGAFGRVEPLTPWRRGEAFGGIEVAAGIDASGRATVAWVRPNTEGGRSLGGDYVIDTATAAPGAAYARQRLAAHAIDATSIALAVAPDGWTVIAHGGAVRAFQRPLGAARFTRTFAAGDDIVPDARSPVVAVRDGGGALVAWRTASDTTGGVSVIARPGAGAFGTPATLAPRGDVPGDSISDFLVLAGGSFPPIDESNGALRAALAPDGRALLAWTMSAPATAEPPRPRLELRAKHRQRLTSTQPVIVTARCDRACDLRAVLRGEKDSRPVAGRTLPRAGTARLAPQRILDEPTGPSRTRIVVHAAAPGGHETVTATVRVVVVPRRR